MWTETDCFDRLKHVALHYSCSPELQLLGRGGCGLDELLTPLLLWHKICNSTFLNALVSLSLPKLLEYIRLPCRQKKRYLKDHNSKSH